MGGFYVQISEEEMSEEIVFGEDSYDAAIADGSLTDETRASALLCAPHAPSSVFEAVRGGLSTATRQVPCGHTVGSTAVPDDTAPPAAACAPFPHALPAELRAADSSLSKPKDGGAAAAHASSERAAPPPAPPR